MKHFCDRCQREIVTESGSFDVRFSVSGKVPACLLLVREVCGDCYSSLNEALRDWVEAGRKLSGVTRTKPQPPIEWERDTEGFWQADVGELEFTPYMVNGKWERNHLRVKPMSMKEPV